MILVMPRVTCRMPSMQNHWEPKFIEATPFFLEEKDYQSLVAELTEILYLHFARQGQNSNVPTESTSEPSKKEAWK